MKRHYIKPALRVVHIETQQMMAMSGVNGTASFSERLTGETTDQALSRHYTEVDDDY